MRLSRKGTLSIEVHSSLSQDYELEAGVGQGDPRSSYSYNLSASPLNHYLATSEQVPRFKIEDDESSPVFFADDDLLLLDGHTRETDNIIQVLQKITDYKEVSGLDLGLAKCEIMSVNCQIEDIDRIVQATGMRKVSAIKHLGLTIDTSGSLPTQSNIEPITAAMERIADTLSTSTSTPIGRGLYAKFLLSSRYLHKVQNFPFTEDQLKDLRTTVLKLTWTRRRIGTDQSSIRTHIANDRVSQPLRYGGLSIPDPIIQTQALKFSWARKLLNSSSDLTWVKLLEKNLSEIGRPNRNIHFSLGALEWRITGEKMKNISTFWCDTFVTIAKIIELSHTQLRQWHLIPILGHESVNQIDASSLVYENRQARNIFESGLKYAGQLFQTNEIGAINVHNLRTKEDIENELNIRIPVHIFNTLTSLAHRIRRTYAGLNDQPIREHFSTLQSILRANKSGCNLVTSLLLTEQRQCWTWGNIPRSYHTYSIDRGISIPASLFSSALQRVKSSILPPQFLWTSIQIFLRTLWTKVKEAKTRRMANQNPIDNSCSNCGLLPEHTQHLMVDCVLARAVWNEIQEIFNKTAREENHQEEDIYLDRDTIMFNQVKGTNKEDLRDIIMVTKHVIYRVKFRENPNRLPTKRMILVMVVLEIEKVILLKNYKNKISFFMHDFNNELRNVCGF